MKKLLAIVLLVGLAFPLLLTNAFAAEDDFSYIVQSDGTIAISKYKGSEDNVVIPESINGMPVTTLGNGSSAIFGSDVYYVTLPEGITRISDKAFENTDIFYITIPEGVTSIGNDAFAGCYGLTSVEIPNSVTEIGSNAFNTGKKPYWTDVEGSILQPTYLAGPRGTYAEQYAKQHNIPYMIYDDICGSTMYVVTNNATYNNWPIIDNDDSYHFNSSIPTGTSFVILGELYDYYYVLDPSWQWSYFGFVEKAHMSPNPSATGIAHVWQEATCTEPATCQKCGITEGIAIGHNWQNATCTKPKTCSVCKVTQGEPTGHSFVPASEHLLACSTCQFEIGRNFDNIQLDTIYIIDDYAEVKFISCEFVESYYQYRQGHAGSSEKETIPSYKNQPMASGGKYYKYITKAASGSDEYLVLQFNVKNTQGDDIAFLGAMSAILKYDNRTLGQKKASFQQQDRKTIENPFGPSEYVRIAYYPGEEQVISPSQTGMYMVEWSVKNNEFNANNPLSIELTIGGKTMTYHIHK